MGEQAITVIAGVLTIFVIYLYFKLLTTIVYHLIIKPIFKYSVKVPFILHLLFFFLFLGFPYLFIVSYWQSKEKDAVFQGAVQNPDDQTVEKLLHFCKHTGFNNHPDTWNELRAVWNVINHSPNVSSDLKRKVIATFTSKGLYINNTNVIDNYKK